MDASANEDCMRERAHKMGMNQYDGDGNPAQIGADLIPRNMRIQSIDTSQFDPFIQDKISHLNNQKLDAVDAEDFDQAKYLKQLVDKLKVMGNQMVNLNLEK